VEHISADSIVPSGKNRFFIAFIIFEAKNIEQEVDLVLCDFSMHVFELGNSFVLERLPVKFATTFQLDIFDFVISVSTTGEAIRSKSKNLKNMQNYKNLFFYVIMFVLIRISCGTHFSKIYPAFSIETGLLCIHNY